MDVDGDLDLNMVATFDRRNVNDGDHVQVQVAVNDYV
jgi:hypothetical protein